MELSDIKRSWAPFILSTSMLIQMLTMPSHWIMSGYNWITLIATIIIMVISVLPYWKNTTAAFKKHSANVNALVTTGTAAAYFYSIFVMITNRPVYFESAAFVTVLILLGDATGEKMHDNASNTLGRSMGLQAECAEAQRDSGFIKILLDQVKVGDTIRVKPGEKIPVSGEILKGVTTLDESMVTGESMPVVKKVGDTVIGPTINSSGTVTFKATKIGSDTTLIQTVNLVRKTQTNHVPIQNLTDETPNVFIPAVVIIVILTFIIWYSLLGAVAVEAMFSTISVIVITCPCALGLTIPTALVAGTARSTKVGVLIKNGKVLQGVNDLGTVVFDKASTITVGKPGATDVVSSKKQVLTIAASLRGSSGRPLATAIVKKTKAEKLTIEKADDSEIIEGKSIKANYKGKTAFVGNNHLLTGANIPQEMTQRATDLQNKAKTVIYISLDGEIIGLVAIQDIPEPSSYETIKELRKHGLKTIMLTEDDKDITEAIAKQVGIDQVITGVLPNEEAMHIKELQEQGKKATFIGNEVGSAPALSTADVGITMGSGTDTTIDSGGIVLIQNNLRSTVRALDISRKTLSRIRLNLFWALIYSITGIPIAAGLFVGLGFTPSPGLAGLAMALSSVSVVGSSLMLNKTGIVGDVAKT